MMGFAFIFLVFLFVVFEELFFLLMTGFSAREGWRIVKWWNIRQSRKAWLRLFKEGD